MKGGLTRQQRRHPDAEAQRKVNESVQRFTAELMTHRVAVAAASYIMAQLRPDIIDPAKRAMIDRFLEAHPAPPAVTPPDKPADVPRAYDYETEGLGGT